MLLFRNHKALDFTGGVFPDGKLSDKPITSFWHLLVMESLHFCYLADGLILITAFSLAQSSNCQEVDASS